MEIYSSKDCFNIVEPLYYKVQSSPQECVNLTSENANSLLNYCQQTKLLELENTYSQPMVWIGIYIALASSFCIIAMAADLMHGFRNRKIWFPCKYFTLNASSITIISVAMKLPMDLSSLMPGYLDQATKLGSIAFMCTMLANLMPSLASMSTKTLLANVIGLAILIITMIVNICIEISTGVIVNFNFSFSKSKFPVTNFMILAYIYVAMLLWLLIMLVSLAITIPTSKQILEFKYQATSKRSLNNQDNNMSTVENLRQYVRRYWVMAESGSPQFVIASNPVFFSCGIICIISLVMHIVMELELRRRLNRFNQSDFKWSVIFIYITQFTGVVVGCIAPIIRCFTILSFKLFPKRNKNHFMVFKVEKYWIQKLCEWKESHIPFLSSDSMSGTLVHNLKNLILSLCIGFQKVIVVSSKMLRLILLVLLICVMYCSYCWKSLRAMVFTPPIASRFDDINEDFSNYVLQLEDKMELGEITLKRMLNSVNHIIQKAEKEQHKDLLMLLETSTGFKGVKNFDVDQFPPLVSVNLVNIWSLPIVTLTCIAIALPNIHKDIVDSFFRSVREGLSYTHLVEETLNNTCEYNNIRRATMTLWHEVQEKCMWLGTTLENRAYKGKTSIKILEWFANKAEESVTQINRSTNKELMVNTPTKLVLANSMYRVTRTILFNYQSNVEPVSEELFTLLSSMIADIFSACFTNIPQVIMMKCHGSAIEKREGSVEAAAKLFGRTIEIIKRLEVLEQPNMDPDKMAYIDEWCLHLKQATP